MLVGKNVFAMSLLFFCESIFFFLGRTAYPRRHFCANLKGKNIFCKKYNILDHVCKNIAESYKALPGPHFDLPDQNPLPFLCTHSQLIKKDEVSVICIWQMFRDATTQGNDINLDYAWELDKYFKKCHILQC